MPLSFLGMVGLADGEWVQTRFAVPAKPRAECGWHRVTGTVIGLANSMRPEVKAELGIESTPPACFRAEASESQSPKA